MNECRKRSLIKAVSWRITGSLDTFVLSYLITEKISYASAISFTELLTKIALYYLHERLWDSMGWGKNNEKKIIPISSNT